MSIRKFFITILVAFLGVAFKGPDFFKVRTVVDGDTVRLQSGEKIRYFGIDTPEMGEVPEFMAVAATNRNRQLIEGKKVRLELEHPFEDRYGRKLAYVFLETGEMINAVLVREGLAYVLVNNTEARHFPQLLGNQRLAMTDKVGIWSREARRLEEMYVGNQRTCVFHRPGCIRAKEVAPRNRHPFPTRRSAFWEGFHPCSICRP